MALRHGPRGGDGSPADIPQRRSWLGFISGRLLRRCDESGRADGCHGPGCTESGSGHGESGGPEPHLVCSLKHRRNTDHFLHCQCLHGRLGGKPCGLLHECGDGLHGERPDPGRPVLPVRRGDERYGDRSFVVPSNIGCPGTPLCPGQSDGCRGPPGHRHAGGRLDGSFIHGWG